MRHEDRHGIGGAPPVNAPVLMSGAHTALSAETRPAISVMTASYAGDFERCRLLCETMDRHTTGFRRHYLLCAPHDVERFQALASPNRIVIDEREILPRWLRAFPDPLSLGRRHIWLSLRTPPLRGWHVQQLRRIALASAVDEDILVSIDSDVVFLRPFDAGQMATPHGVRMIRRQGAAREASAEHRGWIADAGRVLGLDENPPAMNDYVGTLIAWRREDVLGMCARIEALHGRHWATVVAARRSFSECMLYGRYVDEVLGGAGHVAAETELCRVLWTGDEPSDDELKRFAGSLEEGQVAIGIQSFIGVGPERLRRLLLPSG